MLEEVQARRGGYEPPTTASSSSDERAKPEHQSTKDTPETSASKSSYIVDSPNVNDRTRGPSAQ